MAEGAEPSKLAFFGSFELDLTSAEVRMNGHQVRLQEQSFRVLKMLIERPGEVVTRDEIRAQLWADGTVVDFNHSINATIKKLRAALADSPEEPRYIETVGRRGYRWKSSVEWAPPEAGSARVPPQASSARLPKGLALLWHRLLSGRAKWLPLIGVAAAGIAATVLWIAGRGRRGPEPVYPIPITTLPGAEWSPTFSPDGSQVAFTWNGDKQDNFDIYVTVIGVNGGLPLRLTSDPASDVDPAWSPDGRWIAFRRIAPSEHQLLLVSPLGTSVEQKVGALPCPGGHCSGNLWSNRLSWSSDGRFVAASDVFSPHSKGQIFLFDVETREKRSLNLPSGKEFASSYSPAFSPDGRRLAFVAGETGEENIYVQKLDSALRLLGQPIPVAHGSGYPALDWTEDSRSVIYSSVGLWRVPADGGRAERLPVFASNTFAIARRGKRLAYSAESPLGAVFETVYRANRQSGEAGALVSWSSPVLSPQYSDDGTRVVFVSTKSGRYEIWTCSSNGTNCFQLTSGGGGSPRFSPDGRYVAFDSGRYGSWDIFVVNSSGGTARRLTMEDSSDSRPAWSRDGKWIYFGSNRSGGFQIWKIPAGGGTARQVTRNEGFEAVESHDGTAVYYNKRGEEGVWTVPVAGGDEKLVVNQGEEGKWALGAHGIYVLSKTPVCAVDYFDFAKKSISRVTTLPVAKAAAMLGVGPEFAVSPDERWFLYERVERNESDLLLLEKFPK
jgi:Tol biopolymer transport system component/DNA-binding winged helix-turn-helix (wHTH) protein